jgi:hypothetical protein
LHAISGADKHAGGARFGDCIRNGHDARADHRDAGGNARHGRGFDYRCAPNLFIEHREAAVSATSMVVRGLHRDHQVVTPVYL